MAGHRREPVDHRTDWDYDAARLFTLKRHLGKALGYLRRRDPHPAFPETELNREQSMALARLVQVRDEPTALAAMATAARSTARDIPTASRSTARRPRSARSTAPTWSDFYRTHFRPEQATLIVVGDVTLGGVGSRTWKRPSPVGSAVPVSCEATGATLDEPAVFRAPPAARKPTRIVLVDKPGAAQSVIAVSLIGAERNSPDYYALTVMNSIFGGQFSSRLNLNLREAKGYTYGARTLFDWRVPQPGPFVATASVQTAVTAPPWSSSSRSLRAWPAPGRSPPTELDFSQGLP